MYMLVSISSVANFITAYEVSIKLRLPFPICNVFFVFKGNLLNFLDQLRFPILEKWHSRFSKGVLQQDNARDTLQGFNGQLI